MIVNTPFFISPAYCGAQDHELAALEVRPTLVVDVIAGRRAGRPETRPALKIT